MSTGTGEAPRTSRDRTARPVSRRLLTVPNVLSVVRLLGLPLYLWLLVEGQVLWAAGLLVLSGVTDWLDGTIARRFDQVSRLGQLLDPIADRLYIAPTLLSLAWYGVIPWWLVVVLVARDAFILAMAPLVRRHRLPIPPVHFIGKAATFNLIYAFPLMLLGDGDSTLAHVALPIGWAFAWWGTLLYWLAAVMYAVQVTGMVRHRKAQLAAS